MGRKPNHKGHFDDEENEILKAVDEFRTRTRRIPSVSDIVAIMRDLGWSKRHGKRDICY